jgi:hypothetical protein
MYSAVSIAAGILILAGTIIVIRHSPAKASGTLTVWGGSGAVFPDPSSYPSQSITSATVTTLTQRDQSLTFGAIPPAPVTSGDDTSEDDIYGLSSLLAMISQPGNLQYAEPTDTPLYAYSYLPTGLISTSTPAKTLSARQKALFEYGNTVGGSIQSYENAHTNTTQILKNQVEDRRNTLKNQAVVDIGASLTTLGEKIASIEEVPADAAGLNSALAESYKELGAKLSLIPAAERDADFVQAITTYNTAADAFSKNFVALATLFSVSGITFDSGDAGSVFTFTGGGGGGL